MCVVMDSTLNIIHCIQNVCIIINSQLVGLRCVPRPWHHFNKPTYKWYFKHMHNTTDTHVPYEIDWELTRDV